MKRVQKLGTMLGGRQLSQRDTTLATSPWVIEKDVNRLEKVKKQIWANKL